jgi:hypothetical protein
MEISAIPPGSRSGGPECLFRNLEEAPALAPLILGRRPIKRAGVPGVNQHVVIEHVGQNTLMVGGFPIRSLFRLRVAGSQEADPALAGAGALSPGRLWAARGRIGRAAWRMFPSGRAVIRRAGISLP